MATSGDPPGEETQGAGILLGLFIVWQIVFLMAHNLLAILEDTREVWPGWAVRGVEALAPGFTKGQGHLADGSARVKDVTRRWAQVTGQAQNWSLFAPAIASE